VNVARSVRSPTGLPKRSSPVTDRVIDPPRFTSEAEGLIVTSAGAAASATTVTVVVEMIPPMSAVTV
jgi:hypothetical protein